MYVDAPLAVNVPVPPVQIVVEVVDIVGAAFVVTVVVADAEQVPAVTTTVYVVFVFTVAVTTLPVVALRPVAGLQLYVLAPDVAVNVAMLPAQTVGLFTVITKLGITFTATVILPVQVPDEPSIV